jgi:hypothetical protein
MSDTVQLSLNRSLADRYELSRELGQGGMATVYLARDLRHDRQVALKVLHPDLAATIGADRFLSEIKTTANLQHPHILPLHDSGVADGYLFYVMPYVSGETLRSRLEREQQLPVTEAVRIAAEVADALGYAHKRGIVHRDIKPENILLQDGHAVVADFGIALAVQQAGGQRLTQTGLSLGTPQYMAPEQAMGDRHVDARADVYALGVVLYEMLAGEPPFTGPSAQAIVAKVITEAPRPLRTLRPTVSIAVESAVMTALQKLPADRQSNGVEFGDALARPVTPDSARPTRSGLSPVALAIAAVAFLAVGVLTTLGVTRGKPSAIVTYIPKTFNTQAIFTARLAADGKTILFSAAAEGHTPRIYIIRPEYAEAQPVSDSGVHLLAVSSQNEMAVLTNAQFLSHLLFIGTLARMPIGGGAPRPILQNVREADWSRDGTQLAVIHEMQGRDRLEFPIGKVLYTAPRGYISDVRISPRGDRVAFFQHPTRYDDRGEVMTVDLSGKTEVLARDFWGIEGAVWTPDGKRLLFSAARDSTAGQLQVRSVDRPGNEQVVLGNAGELIIRDATSDGRWLITRDDEQFRLLVRAPGGQAERDLTWLVFNDIPLISGDGRTVAFSDEGPDGGPNYTVMLRGTDGGPAVKLGEGSPLAATRDFRWILAGVPSTPPRVMLYPTGPGEPKRVEHGEFDAITSAIGFGRNEQSVYICGVQHAGARGCFDYRLAGGAPTQIVGADTIVVGLSPDQKTLLMRTGAGVTFVRSLEPGVNRVLATITADDEPIRWSPDSKSIWVRRANEIPLRVSQVDGVTGRRSPLVTFDASDRHGLVVYVGVSMADDPKVAAFVARRYLGQIYMVTGAR